MLKLPTPLMVVKKTDDMEEEPLSPAARLFHQPNFNCFVIVIMGIGKKIDVDIVKAGFEASIVHHPRFSSLQVFDPKGRTTTPKWVKTAVVVQNHFVVPHLTDLTIPNPDQFVEDYISDLSTTTLDFSKPLWDLHILNIRTSEAQAVGVLRCHHSLGDGLSLMSLLLACFRTTSDPTELPTIPTKSKKEVDTDQKKKEKKKKKKNRWVRVGGMVAGLFMTVGVMWNTLVDIFWFIATVLGLKDTETPIKGRKGVEFNKKRFVHGTLILDDINCVRSAMKATVNDVLLGISAAGLTRYLCRRYGDDANEKLPKSIRMRSVVLVNQRKTPEVHALADMMEGREMSKKKNAQFGNWIGYVILPFQIVERENPLDYVQTAARTANRKKSSWEAFFTFASARLVIKLLGIKVASLISHKALSNTTLSFSNIIGPVEEVGFSDHPLVYIAPSVYGHPHALTMHFHSYMGKLKMVVAVDETLIPDPHQLCTDLADCLIDMKNAAIKISDKEAASAERFDR